MLGGENETVNIAAEADGVKPKTPQVALGRRRGAGKAIDGGLLDGRPVDVLDPARSQVVGERLLRRHTHNVEPKGLAAAALDAEHGLRGIVEREAVRRGKREAELGV